MLYNKHMRFLSNQKLQPGDLIRVQRSKKYYHYGIVVNNNNVIHFTGPVDDSIMDVNNIQIRETSLDLFLRGDKIQILKPYSSPFDRNVVVERAEAFIGKNKLFGKSYNLVSNNCEHFASYIYFGKKESKQVRLVSAILAGVALVGATTTAAAIAVGKKLKKR